MKKAKRKIRRPRKTLRSQLEDQAKLLAHEQKRADYLAAKVAQLTADRLEEKPVPAPAPRKSFIERAWMRFLLWRLNDERRQAMREIGAWYVAEADYIYFDQQKRDRLARYYFTYDMGRRFEFQRWKWPALLAGAALRWPVNAFENTSRRHASAYMVKREPRFAARLLLLKKVCASALQKWKWRAQTLLTDFSRRMRSYKQLPLQQPPISPPFNPKIAPYSICESEFDPWKLSAGPEPKNPSTLGQRMPLAASSQMNYNSRSPFSETSSGVTKW